METIDFDLLITLVQEQPVIWDKTTDDYKDRTLTRNAWTEVFKHLNDKFEEMESIEKTEFGKAVMKKWANLRDCFQRSERNYKAAMKSGSARQPPKTYIYNDQLQFLKKSRQAHATDDSFSESVIGPQPDDFSRPILSDNEGSETQVSPINNQPTSERVRSFRKTYDLIKNKRKGDSVKLELISVLKEKPCRHASFFNGIIPTLDTFDDDEIVEFQLNVMQLLSNMKKSKKSLPIQKEKQNIVSSEGHRYQVSQPSSLANSAGSSTTSTASY